MATKKKSKPVSDKELIRGIEEPKQETITEIIKPSDAELIRGADEEVKTVKVVNYTAQSVLYKVTNIKRNRVYTLNGVQIGAILGMNNDARKQLKEGVKKVVVKNRNNEELYKIEVL